MILITFIKRIFNQLILSAESTVNWYDKLQYFLITVLKLSPFAFILDGLNIWFTTNKTFFSFILFALLGNMIVGIWKHRKLNTFCWEQFFKKNILMWVVIIITYPILEMLRHLTGDNIIGEGFSVIIQVATFLYPASKILKNMYIVSNGDFPPEFIMTRLYKFEKTGNLDYIFSKDKIDEMINTDIER